MDANLTPKKKEAGVSKSFVHLKCTPRPRTNKAIATLHLNSGVLL